MSSFRLCLFIILCLLSSDWLEGASGKSLKIIIPHKIRYVHHHHHHHHHHSDEASRAKHKRFAPFQSRHFHPHHEQERGEREEEFESAEEEDYYPLSPILPYENRRMRVTNRYSRDRPPEHYLQRLKLPQKQRGNTFWF